MLYVHTYIHTCARSQGVRKVVKSEGASTQTIRNLGIKVRAIKSMYRNKEVSYSHIILLVLYVASFSYIIAQWITSHVLKAKVIPHVLRV